MRHSSPIIRLSCLVLLWPIPGLAANVLSVETGKLKMHIFMEPTNDAMLTVPTTASNGSTKNLKMVVFDGENRPKSTIGLDNTGQGRSVAASAGPDAQPVLNEYPRRTTHESEMAVNTYGELGYRHDKLKWNIAGPSGNPNILSELQWNDIQSAVITGGTDITFAKNWQVNGKMSYGKVVEGRNRDSDYALNNRQGEFSRSNNDADDGLSIDLSADLGYHLTWGSKGRQPFWRFTPKVGYAFHTQQFNMTHGVQTIPATGSFNGLDSSYEGTWFGPWGGLSNQLAFNERFSLEAGIAYHWIDYEGTGKWNLRSDFRQPKSFTHDAEGEGIVANVMARYLLTPDWVVRLSAEYQDWQANNGGRDKTFFSDGSTGETRLNEVKWKSYGFNFGIEYVF